MKYYAVVKGIIPGIYDNWNECSEQVTGYYGAIYKSFKTKKLCEEYIVSKGPITSNQNTKQINTYQNTINIQQNNTNIQQNNTNKMIKKPVLQILTANDYNPKYTVYCDGGQNKLTGKDAWGCCTNNLGDDLLIHNKHLLQDMKLEDHDLPMGRRTCIIVNFNGVKMQNNGAELLSMVASLRIALYYNKNSPKIIVKHIGSDSKTIIESWSKGRVTRETKANMPTEKYNYILELVELVKEFERYGGTIEKIPGAINPSDLGYH